MLKKLGTPIPSTMYKKISVFLYTFFLRECTIHVFVGTLCAKPILLPMFHRSKKVMVTIFNTFPFIVGVLFMHSTLQNIK